MSAAIAVVAFGAFKYVQRPQQTRKLAGLCRINLRLIESAKLTWVDEHPADRNDDAHMLEGLRRFFSNGQQNPNMPRCPCGGEYIIGRVSEQVRCSLAESDHTYGRGRLNANRTFSK